MATQVAIAYDPHAERTFAVFCGPESTYTNADDLKCWPVWNGYDEDHRAKHGGYCPAPMGDGEIEFTKQHSFIIHGDTFPFVDTYIHEAVGLLTQIRKAYPDAMPVSAWPE